MKTYVAEDVLTSWTSGLIVVKAENIDEAIKLILKEFDYDDLCCGESGEDDNKNKECLKKKMRELKDNELVYIYGGD